MKRTLLLINLLLLSVCVFPQENIEVNYATIKKYVENQSDDYQQLIERFEANDSLLSLNDYALIYYGHSFTPKYKGSMELWKELETLMEENLTFCRFRKSRAFSNHLSGFRKSTDKTILIPAEIVN